MYSLNTIFFWKGEIDLTQQTNQYFFPLVSGHQLLKFGWQWKQVVIKLSSRFQSVFSILAARLTTLAQTSAKILVATATYMVLTWWVATVVKSVDMILTG